MARKVSLAAAESELEKTRAVTELKQIKVEMCAAGLEPPDVTARRNRQTQPPPEAATETATRSRHRNRHPPLSG